MEVDARSLLPADDMAYGFDNIADALAFSPGLLERYLLAARRISRAAIGDPTIQPDVETYSVSKYLVQDDRMSEELPFGTRGGMAIRHMFPVDGDYVLRIHLTSRRFGAGAKLDVRLDGERVALVALGDQLAGGATVSANRAQDGAVEIPVSAMAGPRLVAVAFQQITSAPEGLAPVHLPVGSISFRQRGLQGVEITGPHDVAGVGDSPSRRLVFVCHPASPSEERPCARRILRSLARRAYRRPVGEADVDPLVGLYDGGRRTGGFDVGIRRALEGILVDPEFLFRIERDPSNVAPGNAYRLTDLELASRLSFFLWSSVPDDELLDQAAAGRLTESSVLEQ